MTPVRATYRDCSRKLFVRYASSPFLFGIDGHTLNQVEREARQLFLVGVALPEAIRYVRALPGSAGVVHACDSDYGACLKIVWNYIGRAMASSGWAWEPFDRYYSHDEHILALVHDYALHHGAPTDPLLTPDLLDLLDLRVVNGALVDGAAWQLATPPGPADPAIGNAGKADTHRALAPLTPTQAALLAAVVQAHATHTGVQAAMLAFEASAADLTQLHLFRLADFTGFADGYSAADLAVLEQAQDRLMTAWAAGFTAKAGAPDWRVVMMKSIDHSNVHKAQNLRGLGFTFGLSMFDADGSMCAPGTWTVETAAGWIARGFVS